MGTSQAPESEASHVRALSSEQRDLAGRHLRLVAMHLRNRVPTPRQPRRQREYDDLYQEGCLALVRAAGRFRPGRDGQFAAYALPRVRGAVHVALHEYFDTIRVPMRARRTCSEGNDPAGAPVGPLPEDLVTFDPPRADRRRSNDTIRHLLRARFERAVRAAVQELQDGALRAPARRAALARIAAERVLISLESARTPLRTIADECGISSGRACEYEHRLLHRTRELMRDDPQIPLLVQYARRAHLGYETRPDERCLQQLEQAELRRFRRQFAALPQPRRADLVYRLLEASTSRITDIAVNLYRLAAARL